MGRRPDSSEHGLAVALGKQVKYVHAMFLTSGLSVIRPPSLRYYDFPLPRCDIVMKSDGNVYLAI